MSRFIAILLFLFCISLSAQKSDFKHINFEKADSIARSCSRMPLKNMPLLVHRLTNKLDTQVEQFRAIHTWVCLNIESDHYFSEETLKKRKQLKHNSVAFSKWNTKVQSKVFKRLLRDKKTICSGYAYITKALLEIAEIECKTIDGYGRNTTANVETVDFPNHSWNAVKLEGKWYLVDTTQASGYYNLDENEFVKDYNEGYFLPEPQLFAKNHYPLDNTWLLLDDAPSLKTFVNAPIIYGDTYEFGIIPTSPKDLVSKIIVNDELEFTFNIADEVIIKDVSLVMTSGFRYKKIQPTKSNYKNGVLTLKYQFKKKGHYDVHAKVGDAIVVSYTVKVEKPPKIKREHS